MTLLDRLFGTRLASGEEHENKIGVLAGVPILGIDGISSIGYGTESALSVLVPLGSAALIYLGPITAIILGLLCILLFSYRQTIAAYPSGGGSYTVASENLGRTVGLFSAAALMVDYTLTVAVGIAAGVASLISAVPHLQHYLLLLCLLFLAFITLVNLRGVKESAFVVGVPLYLLVLLLGAVLVVGTVKAILHGGHLAPIVPPPAFQPATETVTLWLLMKGFANGCTAMTGVEAVSNGVTMFKTPGYRNAQKTLTCLVVVLLSMLAMSAYLTKVFGILAMDENKSDYQTTVSLIIHCVVGSGPMYYLTQGTLLVVLLLSVNTAYAGFPRLCRLVALDGFLPHSFALLGRRLVYTFGIVFLSGLAAILIIVTKGITDDLIPLYAIGAFLAFTSSQSGMVAHWLKAGKGHATSFAINLTGALATGAAVIVIMVAKFTEHAWISIILMPILVFVFFAVKRHYDDVKADIERTEPMTIVETKPPIVMVPVGEWNHLSEMALRFAMRMSPDVVAVHVMLPSTSRDDDDGDEQAAKLKAQWEVNVVEPVKAAGMKPPALEFLTSPYRRVFKPMEEFIHELRELHPERIIAVVIPELIETKWYEFMLHNHRATALKARLLLLGDSNVIVINIPWYFKRTLRQRKDISHLLGGGS